MLNRSADQLTLGLLVPANSLGFYAVAASASSPLPSLVASLGMVGLPTITPLTGQAKAAATWAAMRRAAHLLAFTAPPLAALLPWAIPLVYSGRYTATILPAEFLLIGAVFAALTTVSDDLLRAHGCPGFVSVAQGIGGIVTVVGTLMLDGHPLAAVSLISSLGFAVTFALTLTRLWAAARTLPPSRESTAAVGIKARLVARRPVDDETPSCPTRDDSTAEAP